MARNVLNMLLALIGQTAPEAETTTAHSMVVFLDGGPAAGPLEQRVEQLLQSLDLPREGQAVQLFPRLRGFRIDLTAAQADHLRSQPGVTSIEIDGVLHLEPQPPEPERSDGMVALPKVLVNYTDSSASSGEIVPWGVKAVWRGQDISSLGNVGSGTWAFIIDSGILDTTGDLNVNTSWSRSWVTGESPFTDGVGHGTHVAGTIAALANGIGVVGVAPGAEVVSLKVFDSLGGGASYSTIIAALDYAVSVITTNALDPLKVVINMSLGGPYSSSLDTAVRNAADLGIRLAVAAGNGDASGHGVDADTVSPASAGDHPNVYAVSAVDSLYQMATFSNWDRIDASDSVDDVDVAAPGVDVLSYNAAGKLARWSGTSMATPHVAGLLLLGGVTPGDLVTANAAGAPDPFALGTSFPTTAPTPTYQLIGPPVADEGSSILVAISTTLVAAGTTLYWRLSGAGISTADFNTVPSLTGSATVQADGSASISLSVAADTLSEGKETLLVDLLLDAASSSPVARTSITLNDTSLSPQLWGTIGNDTIVGSLGNDRLSGIPAIGTSLKEMGKGQIDTLTGGLGSDVFVLGDSRGKFYDDGLTNNLGSIDYAKITDFKTGIDKLQLKLGNYIISAPVNGVSSLYIDNVRDGQITKTGPIRDELIAQISGLVNSTDLIWV